MNNVTDEKKEIACGECVLDCDQRDEEEIEQEENKMYLHLDDDTNLECDVLAIFDVDDREYVVLLPIDEEEALIYEHIALEDDQVNLISIESEEEFEKVSKVFYDIYLEEEELEENK